MDHSPSVFVDPADRPVIATADDALCAKQATVAAGYYSDPYLDCFAKTPLRMVQPIIKRGTHARVACIDRAIMSFCKLHTNCQIVVLGAGMDTTFLRSEELLGISPAWFEVDHPSVVVSKSHTISKNADKLKASVTNHGTDCTIETQSSNTCQCIGHDLREPPSELFAKLSKRGFKTNVPTLFLLECVQMYLPEDASRALLSQLVTTCKQNASVVVYDPIAQYDAFGEVMERHLVSAGMAAAHTSLLQTRTLQHQLSKLTDCGFGIAVGCDMWQAYETILTDEQRVRANRCELLDELEEWKMLMQHYCLAVGSSVESGFCEVGSSSPMGFVKEKSGVSRRQES